MVSGGGTGRGGNGMDGSVMGMVVEGGVGGVGGTGTELGWRGECDGDGGGGRQSWRHIKGSICTSRGLLEGEVSDQCGNTREGML